jgi:UPF0176 protein
VNGQFTKMRLYNIVNRNELKERMLQSGEERVTLSFYHYFKIEQPQVFRDEQFQKWREIGVFGRVYVAHEGINAQISVPTENFEAFKNLVYGVPEMNGIRLNVAIEDDGKSFYKLTIKIREKILADGLIDETFDVRKKGVHVNAEDFNRIADDPNTVIIDMRNHYESEIGHFDGAITPDVETFRDSLPIIEKILADKKDKNLLMYCTGGIRCEKASAYFKHRGFKNVFQLEGGIIEYARQVQDLGLKNKFIGKNFVFDERMAEVITPHVISRCHQCGQPADTHINCGNEACHLLFIQCPVCAAKFDKCCSTICQDFTKLPIAEQKVLRKTHTFNGSTFSKNRFSLNKLYVGEFAKANVQNQHDHD